MGTEVFLSDMGGAENWNTLLAPPGGRSREVATSDTVKIHGYSKAR